LLYRIEILRTARKQLEILPRKSLQAVVKDIDSLKQVPRPDNCRKLRGVELWRVRVERYRIIYSIDDKQKLIRIVKIAARREDTYQGI
jgi:mRNA interferase RelE/StbE